MIYSDKVKIQCHERDLEVPTIHEREPNEVRMIPNESIYNLIMRIMQNHADWSYI